MIHMLLWIAIESTQLVHDDPARAAAERLAWDMESRKSIEFTVRTHITKSSGKPMPGAAEPFQIYEEHYIETAIGQRFSEFRGLRDNVVVSRAAYYADGKRFAQVNFNGRDPNLQNYVLVTRYFAQENTSDHRDVPRPFLFLYVGREPLHKALPRADYQGTTEVIGRKCEGFLFEQVRWTRPQDQVFWLDAETSVPLKVEAFKGNDERERGAPVWTWVVESLEQFQGRHIPTKGTQTGFDAKGEITSQSRRELISVHFDRDYPPETFWPKYDPSVAILDNATGKAQTAPGENKAAQQNAQNSVDANPPNTAKLPRADPSLDWTSYAPAASLCLGVVVLIAAFITWRRR
jgi:hypothetical protein